ncbi:MAG: carboxypeptidase-like regulatory domain-containing protein, partial [Maioricimonas sp. JB049]
FRRLIAYTSSRQSRTTMITRQIPVLVSLVVLLVSGCGETNPLDRQPVSGTISLNGQPLETGTIEFAPQGSGTASGASIRNGTYSIPADKGLPPGDYLVRISAADEEGEPMEMPGESAKLAPELIPPEYNTESEQTFTVSADGNNEFSLDIQTSSSN